jgi:hypothetical protein
LRTEIRSLTTITASTAMKVLAQGKPDGGGDVSGDGWPTGAAPTET